MAKARSIPAHYRRVVEVEQRMRNRLDYLRYLENHLGSLSELPKPGTIILRGSGLIDHPHVKLLHEYVAERYEPPRTRIALLLPCCPAKPYCIAPSRVIVYKTIVESGLVNDIQVYTVSDPMGLVPVELEEFYPVANYDHPPELLPLIRDRLREVIKKEFERLEGFHEIFVALVPRRYVDLLSGLSEKLVVERYRGALYSFLKRRVVELGNMLKRSAIRIRASTS